MNYEFDPMKSNQQDFCQKFWEELDGLEFMQGCFEADPDLKCTILTGNKRINRPVSMLCN